MAADRQNFTLYVGDDAMLDVAIVDENAAPLPLDGASFVWTLSRQVGSKALITKRTGNGITITDSAHGAVQIAVSHNDSVLLPPGAYWHQLVLTDAVGLVSTVTTGYVTILNRS